MGFDIEMAHTFARDLKVKLELVPIEPDRLANQLNAGYCDIVMSGMPITPERAQEMAFSEPYRDATIAFMT